MFDFFKKKKSQTNIDEVIFHLKQMGYDILPYGVGVAGAELISGYNAVETASHIAFTTMALDIKEAGENATALMAFQPHALALLKLLKEYKDNRMMNPTQWKNDSDAVLCVSKVDEHQVEWIDKILSDPIAGKERMAKSRIT